MYTIQPTNSPAAHLQLLASANDVLLLMWMTIMDAQ